MAERLIYILRKKGTWIAECGYNKPSETAYREYRVPEQHYTAAVSRAIRLVSILNSKPLEEAEFPDSLFLIN